MEIVANIRFLLTNTIFISLMRIPMQYKQHSRASIEQSQPVYETKKTVIGREMEDIGNVKSYSQTDVEAIQSICTFVNE